MKQKSFVDWKKYVERNRIDQGFIGIKKQPNKLCPIFMIDRVWESGSKDMKIIPMKLNPVYVDITKSCIK